MRICLAFLILAGTALPQDPDASAVRLKWKLAKYDFARYKASLFTAQAPDSLTPNTQRVAGLFGYEILDETRYVAAPRDDRDIPLSLVWTLPTRPLAVGQSMDLNLDFDPFNYGPISVRGTIARRKSVTIDGASCIELVHKASLSPKKGGNGSMTIKGGSFAATLDFDSALGLARKTRFSWSYTYEVNVNGKNQECTIAQNEVLEYLKTVQRRGSEFEGEVNAAIDKGVEAIWKKFNEKDGHWEKYGEHEVGPSALSLLAILKGTLDRKDPRIRKALDWIVAQPFKHTYDTGIALLALEAYYSPRDPSARFKPGDVANPDIVKKIEKPHAKWAAEAAKWLETKQLFNGLWTYPMDNTLIATGDYSNTQYGVLGLFAASHIGAPVDPNAVYRILKQYAVSQQQTGSKVDLARTDQAAPRKDKGTQATRAKEPSESRGWGYNETPGQAYGSMTLGGIGSLTILDSILRRMGFAKYDRNEQAKIFLARRDGWAWMQSNWSVRTNATYGWSWYCYYLYAMERAAMLSGLATLGGHDWYWEGAEVLVSNQAADGAWFGNGIPSDTCFCVLFLKRATYYLPTPTK